MKKIGLFFSLSALFLSLASHVRAEDKIITPQPVAYVFGSDECAVCKDEVRWLFNEGIQFQYLNTSSSTEVKAQYEALLKKHDIHAILPLTIIGPEVIVGYEKDQVTGHEITLAVLKAKKSDIVTVEDHLARAPVMAPKKAERCEGLACETTNLQTIAPIPFLGLVNLHGISKNVVALSLGIVTISRLLSIGWILITLGVLILMPRYKYLLIAAVSFALIEIIFYFYFFNSGYTSITRFLIEASFAKVLIESTGLLPRQWYIILYSSAALIDNVLVTVVVIKLLPYLRKLDDTHPGSVGILASVLLFIGGSAIVYFVQFP